MRSFVLPPTGPGHDAHWTVDGQLLALLYREIGCDSVDSVTVNSPAGLLSVWVDDMGLLTASPAYNDRVLAFCRAYGANLPALAGTVVFTGGPLPDGSTPGLTDDQVQLCERLVSAAADVGL